MFNRQKWQKEYSKKNKERIAKFAKEYQMKNRDRYSQYTQKKRERYLKLWEDFIPIKTQCQMCGKDIYFGCKDKKNAIHFDHRNEGFEVIEKPQNWLAAHPRTPENEKIWLSCDFGMLCDLCNMRLPTKNRKEFIMKATKYIFGKGLSL